MPVQTDEMLQRERDNPQEALAYWKEQYDKQLQMIKELNIVITRMEEHRSQTYWKLMEVATFMKPSDTV